MMRSVGTLTRADLAETINRKMGFSRTESLEMVEAILGKMSDALAKGENVKISGFGSFSSIIVLVTDPAGKQRRATLPTSFTYDERIQQLAFVRIGREQAVSLPPFYRSDLVALSPRSTSAAASDLWVMPGDPSAPYEKTTPVQGTDSSEYVTPRVQVITRTYRLGN
jgi:hypothetical protein